jgi:hypothetical protein
MHELQELSEKDLAFLRRILSLNLTIQKYVPVMFGAVAFLLGLCAAGAWTLLYSKPTCELLILSTATPLASLFFLLSAGGEFGTYRLIRLIHYQARVLDRRTRIPGNSALSDD